MKNQSSAKSAPSLAPHKLKLLITVVNRKKTEFYADFLQSFEINMQLVLNGLGTASAETMRMLGIPEAEKGVIISIIKEDMAKSALDALEEKFQTIKHGKGIAYTIPMTGTIGVAIYQFLANLPK
jgi:hypothetical protein